MLKSIGCKYVIIGHSERREYQKEQTEELNLKIKIAIKNNLKVIFCIGEKLSEIKIRNKILKNQLNSIPKQINLKKLIIAYEPVWAIGTGRTPTTNEINNIHQKIRILLSKKIGKEKSGYFHFIWWFSQPCKCCLNIEPEPSRWSISWWSIFKIERF